MQRTQLVKAARHAVMVTQLPLNCQRLLVTLSRQLVLPAKELPINCAARNAVWVYPRIAPPRFPGAPAIVETARSYEMPDIPALPDGADVAVELYRGACTLRLDGESRRVYVRRFRYASFASQAGARRAFLGLWREVERRGSAEEVERAAERWVERQG